MGGSSTNDALKRAWSEVFSLKVMAFVNWEGQERNGVKKTALKDSNITKAVFGKFMNSLLFLIY